MAAGSCPLIPSVLSLLQILGDAIGAALRFLAGYKDGLSVLETIAKILALVVGAIWAWKGFIRNRLRFPSATLEHVITNWTDEDRTFLHVKVRINNTGNVLIELSKGKTWIEKLTPLPSAVRKRLRAGAAVQQGKHEIEWSLIQKHELALKETIHVEPKEIDELHFDFVIPKRVSRILIYTHLENQAKGLRRKIGWNLTTIYAIDSDTKTMSRADEQSDERKLPSVDPEDLPERPVVDPTPRQRIQSPEKTEPPPDDE
jgi:hypothetical protein